MDLSHPFYPDLDFIPLFSFFHPFIGVLVLDFIPFFSFFHILVEISGTVLVCVLGRGGSGFNDDSSRYWIWGVYWCVRWIVYNYKPIVLGAEVLGAGYAVGHNIVPSLGIGVHRIRRTV